MKKEFRLCLVFSVFIIFSGFLVVAQFPPDPEECMDTPLILRGDANGDKIINIGDAIYLLNYLFSGGSHPACLNQADINNDDKIDISDAIIILRYLFMGETSQ